MKTIDEKLVEIQNVTVSAMDPLIIPIYILCDWTGSMYSFQNQVKSLFSELHKNLKNIENRQFLISILFVYKGTFSSVYCDELSQIDCENLFSMGSPFGRSPLNEGLDILLDASKTVDTLLKKKLMRRTIPCFFVISDAKATDEKVNKELDMLISDQQLVLVEFNPPEVVGEVGSSQTMVNHFGGYLYPLYKDGDKDGEKFIERFAEGFRMASSVNVDQKKGWGVVVPHPSQYDEYCRYFSSLLSDNIEVCIFTS